MCPVNGTPIAVVGMGCRLPGGVNSPEEFWAALLAERDLVSEVPADRWNVGPLYDPTPGVQGRTVSRWGGFLDDVAGFDAEFFRVTPREAVWLDPQQRLLLEVGYEALEDAGIPLERVAGSECGVFVGQSSADYWSIMEGDSRRFGFYGMTGAWARSVMSGRLSFAFDLRGPTLSIDTACSSGLAAFDVAVRYLRSGGPMALVGAVNLTLIPDGSIIYSGSRMLSATGRCKFGDADADGFVRSEAAGVVVLEPLDLALAHGDPVSAILLGSANGSDGRDGGLLVRPGPDGQRRVIERACRDAGIDPADVDFVEAHRPGTQAGDPVELTTLGSALGTGRPVERPLLVTSAKTNLGHAEAAAGVVGVIKAVLSLKNRTVPASLHLNRPSPAVPWESLPLSIVRSATPLPNSGRSALAGVNSFGISGNSAHVVLSAAPAAVGDHDGAGRRDAAPVEDGAETARPEALLLSAAGPEALLAVAERWAQFLESSDLSFTDVCHGAAVRRTHHPFRLAAVVDSSADAASALRDYVAGVPGTVTVAEAGPRPRVAFVFPGQGSQWAAMGRTLLSGEPVYAAAFDECGAAIADETGTSIRKLIEEGSDEWLTRTEVVQPVLWAVQVALSTLWRSWGVQPDAVIGHSMGEVAAACVAGALSIRDGAAVICRRSALAARLRGRGAMAWTELTAAQAEQAVVGRGVVAAAFNGPRATVLSGAAEAVSDLVAELEGSGTVARLVNVDFASHCPQIDEITDDLLAALDDCAPGRATVPIRSTLLGRIIEGTEMDAAYWARNIREPVDFTGAVQDQLANAGADIGADIGADTDTGAETIFLEISAHPVLTATIRAHGPAVRALGSLRRHTGEREALLGTLTELHVAGTPIDWSAVAPGGRHVPLPRYPWQHQQYWLPAADEPDESDEQQPPSSATHDRRTADPALHPLLGTVRVSETDGSRQWTGRLDLAANGYVLDHCVQDAAILPGTGYLDVLAAAARRIYGPVPVALTEVRYLRAVFLDPAEPRELRVTARPEGSAWHLTIHSRTVGEAEWTLHVEATGRPVDGPESHGEEVNGPESHGAESEPGGPARLDDAKTRCTEHQSGPDFYAHHAARGNQWNGTFQGLVEVWRGQDEAVARVRLPEAVARVRLPDAGSQRGELFHPALLDSCAQAIAAARPEIAASADAAFVLRSIGAYRLYRLPGPDELWSHAFLRPGHAADSCVASFRIYDGEGLVAEIDDMRMHYLMGRAPAPAPTTREQKSPPPRKNTDSPAAARDWLYRQEWVAAERRTEEDPAEGRWLVFQDGGHVGRDVVDALRRRGHEVATVTAATAFAHSDDSRLRFRADPTCRQDIAAVVSAACAGGPLSGVVYLWGLDSTRSSEPTGWELERALNLGSTGVAHLAQALHRTAPSRPPRLWLVTRGSQYVTDTDLVTGVCQAPVWGLGPALAGEQPELRTTLIDLDERDSTVAPLVRELLTADEEDRVALRGGSRFVARLRRTETVSADRLRRTETVSADRLQQPGPGPRTTCSEPGPGPQTTCSEPRAGPRTQPFRCGCPSPSTGC
ncbi:type I polyketide synthase [Streptomyces sp. NPDC021093]|uniref:type I polyketide synthase n=1 Tax=Streptomyces sp. NPDC021093 TaxID=3365112 RepID=UPI0037B33AAE